MNETFKDVMLPADSAYIQSIEEMRTRAFRAGQLQRAKYYARLLYNLKTKK